MDGVQRLGKGFTVIAGPCSVESEEQTLETAKAVKAAGADACGGAPSSHEARLTRFRGLGLRASRY